MRRPLGKRFRIKSPRIRAGGSKLLAKRIYNSRTAFTITTRMKIARLNPSRYTRSGAKQNDEPK